MNLIIDIGNTRTKIALFKGRELVEDRVLSDSVEVLKYAKAWKATAAILSSVNKHNEELVKDVETYCPVYELTRELSIPLRNNYGTPETLGADRIAAAVGAWALFPGENLLIFDAGTCLTTEFVSAEGIYEGGAISPGVNMRLEAMHRLTARLPLSEVPAEIPELVGKSTAECLQSGAINGTWAEIEGTILRYTEQYTDLQVILCGGDTKIFEKRVKPSIFVLPKLVLYGLNEILLHNAQ
jgi:type III pantothenate kinase